MQISKLYETKITCSNYNPNIDDTITVTVALIDFNGNNVTGTNATITVNQGYFTKYTRNSSDTAISGTTTKSYTGTTGTDGTFTMTYKCSEWGLATFSANNTKTQINTDGWIDVSVGTIPNYGVDVTHKVNPSLKLGHLFIHGQFTGISLNGGTRDLYTITQYPPTLGGMASCHSSGNVLMRVLNENNNWILRVYNNGTSENKPIVEGSLFYLIA